MDLYSLQLLTDQMEPRSKVDLITRIERRILLRLLTQLKAAAPEDRKKLYSEFWGYYNRLPRSLVNGLGVNTLRKIADQTLLINSHE